MDTDSDSRLAGNILQFCRTLRAAGIPVGSAQVLDALRAVVCVGLTRRDDVCWALRAVLVTDPAQFRLFDQTFHVYFRNPRLLERMIALLLPSVERDVEQPSSAMRRLAEALSSAQSDDSGDDVFVEIDHAGSYSAQEVLREKDFEQMSLAEQRDARELLLKELEPLANVPTRRFRMHALGNRHDLRRSMQLMIRNDGQLLRLARKRRRRRPPVLVLLCDISGSMSHYSRLFLHFAHAMTARLPTVHSFVFGTRLTNVSRRLADRDSDQALAAIAADVADWDGGTRIAECLKTFNQHWARRVLAQNAVVVLLSDGLERDTEADLGFQMSRLRRSCRRLMWLNPMLRFDGFAPKAYGIRTMLPHVDDFLPAHNVDSLAGLAGALNRDRRFAIERNAA